MKLKKEKTEKVVVTVKSTNQVKSKSITVYETTFDDMLKAIKEMIENKAKL
jgi:hypothetical protein